MHKIVVLLLLSTVLTIFVKLSEKKLVVFCY